MALRPRACWLVLTLALSPVLAVACGASDRVATGSPAVTPAAVPASASPATPLTAPGAAVDSANQTSGTLPPASPDPLQPPALVALPNTGR